MSSEIICVMDRSGSMAGMAKEAIGGFNAFLQEQKALPDDQCKMTVIQFDHEYNVIYDATDIQNVSELNEATYVPRGMTALYDAMGRAIDDAMDRIQKEYSEKPRVVFMIMTDGQENASKDYKKDRLEKLVNDLKAEGWQFIFMSSDISSFDADLGIMTRGAANYAYNSSAQGYNKGWQNVAQTVNAYRATGTVLSAAVELDDDGTTKQLNIKARDDQKVSSNISGSDRSA